VEACAQVQKFFTSAVFQVKSRARGQIAVLDFLQYFFIKKKVRKNIDSPNQPKHWGSAMQLGLNSFIRVNAGRQPMGVEAPRIGLARR
jgi:hypothetical protein